MSDTSGVNLEMYSEIMVRYRFTHSDMVAWDGYFSSSDRRVSLQWSRICLVLMPRQYMLGDSVIVGGPYHVGPDSLPFEKLRLQKLHS